MRSLRLLGRDVGLVEPPVLVAADVLRVEDVLVVVLPMEVADAALGVVGDGAVVALAERANPDIQHAVHGRQVAELLAVGRDLRVGALGVSEEHRAGNKLGGGLIFGDSWGRGRYKCHK